MEVLVVNCAAGANAEADPMERVRIDRIEVFIVVFLLNDASQIDGQYIKCCV
jgi:hypothetical protein